MNQKETTKNDANNNMLFVSDLPSDTTEEEVSILFRNYHCNSVKMNRY